MSLLACPKGSVTFEQHKGRGRRSVMRRANGKTMSVFYYSCLTLRNPRQSWLSVAHACAALCQQETSPSFYRQIGRNCHLALWTYHRSHGNCEQPVKAKLVCKSPAGEVWSGPWAKRHRTAWRGDPRRRRLDPVRSQQRDLLPATTSTWLHACPPDQARGHFDGQLRNIIGCCRRASCSPGERHVAALLTRS